jgi:hypothetical protein
VSEVRHADADSGTVFRLVYRSRSRIPDATAGEEFGRILRSARTNNAASGITGALMFYDGWFAQALEGGRADVLGLFDKIRRDPRHDSVEVSGEGPVAARVFARWAMAHVGEHGSPDIPLAASASGVVEAAPWSPTEGQEDVLRVLRDLTRGYGIGA